MATAAHDIGEVGDPRDLRYSARAGLLPELSRQTYDSFHKALREVVLNSLDADASEVMLDFSRVDQGEIVVSDDGSGMSDTEVEQSFLSLGGSQKFGEQKKFGRIGIGSLALLHYGAAATVETKTKGSPSVTCARLEHPWSLDRSQRGHRLEDIRAGVLTEARYLGARKDHFTIITLTGVSDAVVNECLDIARFYGLVDKLRRILPLPWASSPLTESLAAEAPEAWHALHEHVSQFAGNVIVKSAWGTMPHLDRRAFGEEADERWDGAPRVLYKDVVVPGSERHLTIAGYFLSQTHAAPRWSGLTARVQNVAVEERTFFDVESDPGFRKYLTGEVFVFGDVDRARLINIDRASFNRECHDYRAAQRFLSEQIVQFKSERIQSPRRAKVAIRRRADAVAGLVSAVSDACAAATRWCEESRITRLPSSGVRIRSKVTDLSIEEMIRGTDNVVVRVSEETASSVGIEIGDAGEMVISVDRQIAEPKIDLLGVQYRVRFVQSAALQAVVLRQRPRELLFNLAHPVLQNRTALAVQTALILELSYLVSPTGSATELYDCVLEIAARV